MGRCYHKLLSSAALVLSPTELRPRRLGSTRLLADENFRSATALDVLPFPTTQPGIAVLAPMADAEDGELPMTGFWSRGLGDPREDADL